MYSKKGINRFQHNSTYPANKLLPKEALLEYWYYGTHVEIKKAGRAGKKIIKHDHKKKQRSFNKQLCRMEFEF